MEIDHSVAWLGLLLLGAIHGINPGMGWLFAVALGLQERRRSTVWKALLPLAAGHALAIGAAVLLAGVVGMVIPLRVLKWSVAAILLGAGVYRLGRSWHPRFGGMSVGARDLTIWSFLMATAHGAGLMVIPLFLRMVGTETDPILPTGMAAGHAHHGMGHGSTAHAVGAVAEPAGQGAWLTAGVTADQVMGMLATLTHTAGYLLVTGLVAVIVYEKLGLRLLGRMWFNLDRVWAVALILTAVLTPLF